MDSRRLKVLFITNWYPSREAPLEAIWAREHAKAAQFHDDVAVLHCVGPEAKLGKLWRVEPENLEELREGVPTYRARYRRSPIPGATYLIYLWSMFQAFRHVVREGFHPDIIHVQVYDAGAPAVVIAKLNRIPIVVTEHFSVFPRRLLGPIDFAKAWLAFRWADMVLPVSRDLQDAIERYGLRARFKVIPNVADTSLFFPSPDMRDRPDVKRIVFVGQLVQNKGIHYLLKAVSQLRGKRDDWHLDIIGDGEKRIEYERLTADLRLGDMVTFHGARSKREVAQFMQQANLFVLPSLAETFSVPAVEALACGTPVLSTRCGGPEEFIVEDVGCLVPSGDANALFRGLDQMLDNPHLYSSQRISKFARERFSPEVVGAQLHAVYESLIRPG
jgi:glycosyltransferase involved in cell wall biosynthesis